LIIRFDELRRRYCVGNESLALRCAIAYALGLVRPLALPPLGLRAMVVRPSDECCCDNGDGDGGPGDLGRDRDRFRCRACCAYDADGEGFDFFLRSCFGGRWSEELGPFNVSVPGVLLGVSPRSPAAPSLCVDPCPSNVRPVDAAGSRESTETADPVKPPSSKSPSVTADDVSSVRLAGDVVGSSWPKAAMAAFDSSLKPNDGTSGSERLRMW